MKQVLKISGTVATLILAMCFSTAKAIAQAAPDLVGSWSLVSLTVSRSGTPMEMLGPHPQGQLIFGSDGRYVLLAVRADLPKIESGGRLSSTAEENKKIIEGSVSHFGTYAVDPAGKVIVFRIQKSTFPNWDGDTQSRPFTLVGDTLTYVTPGSFGYGASTVVWRREK